MPGRRCAVVNCNNREMKTKDTNLNIMYHKFPTKDKKTYCSWIMACRRKGKWNPLKSVICSQHFTENSYQTDLKSQLMGIKVRRKLKTDAVPSIRLTPDFTHDVSSVTNPISIDQCLVQEEQETAIGQKLNEDKLKEMTMLYDALEKKYETLQQSFEDQRKQLESTQKLLTNINIKFEKEKEMNLQLKQVLNEILTKSQKELVLEK